MLSVITVVFNGERFIEDCIKNVIELACSDVEHIIVDGGSTDRTVEIIKSSAQKYSHIRWISEKDRGQSDALNKRVAMAKGEILGILDYDDFYQPNVLNRVSQIFKTLPDMSLLVGNTNLRDETGITEVITPKNLDTISLLAWRIHSVPVCASSYFYHKSLHKKLGDYNIDDHYAMDLDFLIRAVQVANIKYVNEIWANRRHIACTKTVSHIESGEQPIYVEPLLARYRQELPRHQQFQIAICRSVDIVVRLIHIIRYKPQQLLSKIKEKLSFYSRKRHIA